MGRPSQFSPEVRERAVRMVRDNEHEYGSRWEAIRSIAPKVGCIAQALHNWIRKTEPVQIAAATEQARLKELEREVTELRRNQPRRQPRYASKSPRVEAFRYPATQVDP